MSGDLSNQDGTALAPQGLARQATLARLAHSEHLTCLLCGPENPLGLRLQFRVEADGSVVGDVPPMPALQSYPGTLHGGVISSVLDAAMVHALFAEGIVAVTAELTVRFLSPVRVDRPLVVRANVEPNSHGPLFHTRGTVVQDGSVAARATAKFLRKASS